MPNAAAGNNSGSYSGGGRGGGGGGGGDGGWKGGSRGGRGKRDAAGDRHSEDEADRLLAIKLGVKAVRGCEVGGGLGR